MPILFLFQINSIALCYSRAQVSHTNIPRALLTRIRLFSYSDIDIMFSATFPPCWSRVETASLLLDSGADPFAKSKNGDDALQIACLKGFHDIYRLLTSRIQYSTERLANANELIGKDKTCSNAI